MKRSQIILLIILMLTAVLLGSCKGPEIGTRQASTSYRLRFDGELDDSTFEQALTPHPFEFPADHGPHPAFQTEWWYYTGNLQDDTGRHFGYQMTIFRRAIGLPAADRLSAFAADQFYFAHIAITDVDGEKHTFADRYSRGAGSLAGAGGSPLRIWLEDWSIEALDDPANSLRLVARDRGLAIDLIVEAAKPLVAHGEAGFSPKSDQPGSASYYLSFTRMATEGVLELDGVRYQVSGESWFDHEWSTSALGKSAVGWDWFGLQLNDGRELMLFQIRNEDGSLDPVSGGTLVDPEGETRPLSYAEINLAVERTWTSPESGTLYPSQWRLHIPEIDLELEIIPLLEGQEMRVGITYWEGAVRLQGTAGGKPVTGYGYMELTGYERPMEGTF